MPDPSPASKDPKPSRIRNLTGPHIRTLRRATRPKVSQDDLAGRLAALGINLDRSAISRIESQERHVTDIELIAIARALHVSLDRLAGEIDYRQGRFSEFLKAAED